MDGGSGAAASRSGHLIWAVASRTPKSSTNARLGITLAQDGGLSPAWHGKQGGDEVPRSTRRAHQLARRRFVRTASRSAVLGEHSCTLAYPAELSRGSRVSPGRHVSGSPRRRSQSDAPAAAHGATTVVATGEAGAGRDQAGSPGCCPQAPLKLVAQRPPQEAWRLPDAHSPARRANQEPRRHSTRLGKRPRMCPQGPLLLLTSRGSARRRSELVVALPLGF